MARAARATTRTGPARDRRAERAAQARGPEPGGEEGVSPDTGSFRLTGRARASGPGRGRGCCPSAPGAIERGWRTRVLDAPRSGSLEPAPHHRAGGRG